MYSSGNKVFDWQDCHQKPQSENTLRTNIIYFAWLLFTLFDQKNTQLQMSKVIRDPNTYACPKTGSAMIMLCVSGCTCWWRSLVVCGYRNTPPVSLPTRGTGWSMTSLPTRWTCKSSSLPWFVDTQDLITVYFVCQYATNNFPLMQHGTSSFYKTVVS